MNSITYDLNNGQLTLFLSGRIDSNNAQDAQDAIDGICEKCTYETILMDVEQLQYISSAGLRVILRIRKLNPSLRVINAGTEIYEIFDMTGFSEMMPVEKAYRQMSVDGCDIIGQGAKGIVYRYDGDTVVKVYKDSDALPAIKRERELARKAFVLGIPTAISYDVVKVGNQFGSVFELLDAKSFSQLIADNPEHLEKYVGIFTDLLLHIHHTEVSPEDMPDYKDTAQKWLDTDRDALSPEDFDKLSSLIHGIPDTNNMLHCDFHTNNIMQQGNETLLIDMDTLSHGHPIFELANIYVAYVGFGEVDPDIVERFIHLPYKTAQKVWSVFLPLYLGTSDSGRLSEVETKIRLLSYARILRHMLRTKAADATTLHNIQHAKDKIHELLPVIDSLTF